MGQSSITGDESITFTDNMSFDGTERGGKMTTNGQLWVGSTASRHVKLGQITSPDGTISISYSSPNITAVVNGSLVAKTITGDDAVALSPTAGNWNILGQQAGSIAVMDTVGTLPSTLRVEDRTWLTPLVVDPSATVGLRGTYTTIALALTAAVAGQDIFIRPGTYTENLTMKAGVSLVGMPGDNFGQSTGAAVKIIGKLTITFNDRVVISNIWLQTNSDFIISSNNGALITLNNCYINALNNTAISLASGAINLRNCQGQTGTTGIATFAVTDAATVGIYDSIITNGGNTLTANTATNGCLVNIWNSTIQGYFTASSTCQFDLKNSSFGLSALNTTAFTHASTTTGLATVDNCRFFSGTASAVSVSAGATLIITNSVINSTNAAAIAGAGIIAASTLSFINTSSTITTTTQTPLVTSNDAWKVTTPGAYPYTTVPQDRMILVDTSSARSIVPLASPTKGQFHRIKDSVGSAAANNITITPSGANIDGAASSVINVAYGSVDIVFNGTEWSIG